MTRQELHFNPLGKLVAKMTDPVLEKMFKLTKKSSDRATPLFIALAIFLESFLIFIFAQKSMIYSLLYGAADILSFLMLFYIVCVLLGSLASNSHMTHYAMYFHRLGSFWVKLTRTFIPVKGNVVIVPAILIVFAVFTAINAGITISFQTIGGNLDPVYAVKLAAKSNIFAIVGLLDIFVWLVIIRALLSWVSPDPRNPVVQLIVSLTDPIMEPFRRIMPNMGGIDLSPMILIFVVYFIKQIVIRLVGIAL
jgi:YggT family protein